MLELRRATVVAADGARLEVDVEGERVAAWADVGLVGPCEPGDEVVVNVQARRLSLGSGGFDVVHCNLTRGLSGDDAGGAHVMKLNYTSLQHAVSPLEEGERELELPLRTPVAVLALHGQLRPVAWAFARAAPPGATLGYVQTAGGALPGALSGDVRELRAEGLLAAHVTAGPAFGGEEEAITTAAALYAGARRYDAVVAGPGPGILGSASALGHGGLVALDTAHAALALGAPTLLAARMSEADPRERHQGLSHHTRTVRELLLAPVLVPEPKGDELEGYPWPTRSMGRDDPLFFRAAAAAGIALAGMMPRP